MDFDVNSYFDRVSRRIEEMTDEQFDELLTASGIDMCPYLEEYHYTLAASFVMSDQVNKSSNTYRLYQKNYSFVIEDNEDDYVKAA